jgi:hypothetical protein
MRTHLFVKLGLRLSTFSPILSACFTAGAGAAPPLPDRGWLRIYSKHVLQAYKEADLDFLVGRGGAKVGATHIDSISESTALQISFMEMSAGVFIVAYALLGFTFQ